MKDFPEWEKPLAARPVHHAARWADDLGVPRDAPAWQEQYERNLRGIRARAAARVAGLYGLPTGAGNSPQVTAMGVREPGIESVCYDCGNGFGAVVSRGVISYGREDGLWEAALARTAPDGSPEQPDPGTAHELLGWDDDVLGRLSSHDVENLLEQITALAPQSAPAAGQEPEP